MKVNKKKMIRFFPRNPEILIRIHPLDPCGRIWAHFFATLVATKNCSNFDATRRDGRVCTVYFFIITWSIRALLLLLYVRAAAAKAFLVWCNFRVPSPVCQRRLQVTFAIVLVAFLYPAWIIDNVDDHCLLVKWKSAPKQYLLL